MQFYENIENERDRIQKCIQKYGWTSDHNLDWFVDCTGEKDRPMFVEFEDGSGLLAQKYNDNSYGVWGEPLSKKNLAKDRILEFIKDKFGEGINKIQCTDISDTIRSELSRENDLIIGDVDYSLEWPVINMEKYDTSLPGGHFKEIRNARNGFYREHDMKSVVSDDFDRSTLHKIIDDWRNVVKDKDEYNDLKYRNVIDNNFKGFTASRVIIVDSRPVGINAGYIVPNNPERFAGIIGVHDYSIKDLGLILWLEDFDWVKNAGYREMDIQGDEGGGLKFKMQFNPVIERKTDTFSVQKL